MAPNSNGPTPNIDILLNRFRLASRELFNNYFRIDDPYNNDGWILEKRFSEVEAVLFENLVTDPAGLPKNPYQTLQWSIRSEIRNASVAPIMLNRDLNSGYWDYPIREVTSEACLGFIAFFDWNVLGYRDNQYVRAQVIDWISHPETVGKQGLIEAQYLRFSIWKA